MIIKMRLHRALNPSENFRFIHTLKVRLITSRRCQARFNIFYRWWGIWRFVRSRAIAKFTELMVVTWSGINQRYSSPLIKPQLNSGISVKRSYWGMSISLQPRWRIYPTDGCCCWCLSLSRWRRIYPTLQVVKLHVEHWEHHCSQ